MILFALEHAVTCLPSECVLLNLYYFAHFKVVYVRIDESVLKRRRILDSQL